jgi:hypothetical protein
MFIIIYQREGVSFLFVNKNAPFYSLQKLIFFLLPIFFFWINLVLFFFLHPNKDRKPF